MTFRTVDPAGVTATADLPRLGARTGLFWRSATTTLVGIGEHDRIPVDRPDGGGAAQAALAELGTAAFAALPFAPDAPGEMIVPEVTVIERDGSRQVFVRDDLDDARVDALIGGSLESPTPAAPRAVELRSVRPASEWRDTVAVAIGRLAASELSKVVLARELELVADGEIPVAPVVESLVERFSTANVFAIDGFVGASPELLVGRHGRVVSAHPLAGTAARANTPEQDAEVVEHFLASIKDQVEHRITIDWLLDELLPFCSYVDAEPEPSIVSLPNVHHLATHIEGMLSEPAASILDLVAAIHPTPAVGGAPQKLALDTISELEHSDRGRYAGPSGWVGPDGDGEFAVSVRTAQLDGPKANVWAGVGVIEASDPEAELAETQVKFAAMLGTLLALS